MRDRKKRNYFEAMRRETKNPARQSIAPAGNNMKIFKKQTICIKTYKNTFYCMRDRKKNKNPARSMTCTCRE